MNLKKPSMGVGNIPIMEKWIEEFSFKRIKIAVGCNRETYRVIKRQN
jgi:hypothetical protein